MWSSITHNIRTLTRNVWTVVPDRNVVDTADKISIIHLLVAFPFAVKHYLREDYSYESTDLKELLGHVPDFAPLVGGAGEGNGLGTPCFNTDQYIVTMEPALLDRVKGAFKRGYKLTTSRRDTWRAHAEATESNIPLEILTHFTSYVNKLSMMEKPVSITFLNTMNAGWEQFKIIVHRISKMHISSFFSFLTALTSLSDTLSGLERILQTSIPFAYAVHLEHVVWLYLLLLPYQLVGKLDWWTIPAMALGAFCLFGILDIGYKIENPFGTDYNDLVS